MFSHINSIQDAVKYELQTKVQRLTDRIIPVFTVWDGELLKSQIMFFSVFKISVRMLDITEKINLYHNLSSPIWFDPGSPSCTH